MNWSYIGVDALLPLVWALGLAMAAGAFEALRLTHLREASRPAFFRMLKAMAIAFPVFFLTASSWEGRYTLRGLLGVARHRPADQRAMGLLRLRGEGFLKADQAAAIGWFRKAADRGDAPSQLQLAMALASGRGATKNLDEALRWAETSARQGAPEAMAFAGDLLRASDASTANTWYQRALAIYRKRIQSLDADACLEYGQMRFEGKGAEADRVEGLAWMYVARRLGIHPFKSIIVQISEGGLPGSQRVEAAQRAGIILKGLPHSG